MQENEEKNIKIVAGSKKSRTFATAIEKQRLQRKRVPWMSGLVSGLQNRVRRFESARNLERQVYVTLAFFLLHEGHNGIETEGDDKRRKF